jgi:lipopolysaccharide biosynthesis glycosyltransferase
VHVWVLAPDGTGARHAPSFPELTLSWIPIGPLGRRGRELRRVLLPALAPAAERVVVLPLPAVVTADVCELADLDLGGHMLAAPRRYDAAGASGFNVINAAARRLADRPAVGFELRRMLLTRHRFDFDAFRADVLVLDLKRLRDERVAEEALALAAAFELTDIEVLHLLFGDDRATVPERWSVVPTRTLERGPGLRHWADDVKPWDAFPTPERELWSRHAAAR